MSPSEDVAVGEVIAPLLLKISNLLAGHGEPTWAKAFGDLADPYAESPESARASIRRLFGGMGSFNDVVLHDLDGSPLREENETLDLLRNRLFALLVGAVSQRTSATNARDHGEGRGRSA